MDVKKIIATAIKLSFKYSLFITMFIICCFIYISKDLGAAIFFAIYMIASYWIIKKLWKFLIKIAQKK